ncbi:MAG: type II toxin-antitoxin system Phd/YefM family antitoxin [Candidatus Aminicenantes bacterium]|nr:type II toxin-antitoxin system Phd/YefM family antitoxin [Candidatus Aminicenantes bacterium]
MKHVNATEMKNKFGTYLRKGAVEPIFIEKNHNTIAVLLSIEEYERLKKIEDTYWLNMAYEADKEGYLGEVESMKLLKEVIQDEA